MRYTLAARLPDGQVFRDEVHVGPLAGQPLTIEQAESAIADLNKSRPAGHELVTYEIEEAE